VIASENVYTMFHVRLWIHYLQNHININVLSDKFQPYFVV